MTRNSGPLIQFVLFALLLTTAEARLGDNEAEMIERFGNPTSRSKHWVHAQGKRYEMGPKLTFKQDDWFISCDLIDGRCVRISYAKPGDWTEEHIRTVLTANAQGAIWTEKSLNRKMRREWTRSDGSTAAWGGMGGMDLVWDAYNKAKATVEERAKVEAKKKPKI
jgi:hypothetical protein